jgi:hypothetical protein
LRKSSLKGREMRYNTEKLETGKHKTNVLTTACPAPTYFKLSSFDSAAAF